MSKNLVIVESPAKARTIAKYLGDDYAVKSSMGHIRDLPKKGMSVDIEHDFEPTYEIPESKKASVIELKAALKTASTVWLATDSDREGEAIAWHLSQILGLKPEAAKRIVFHEITESAVKTALAHPRGLDINLVDAQQARRILDRLVGYELSLVLWKKVRPGLSAGRVQSVAVRLIVEREREIAGFKPTASFKITASLLAGTAELNAEAPENLDSETRARELLEHAKTATYSVRDISTKAALKNPPPPFITSTLQQTASSRLGWSVKQTMVVAQQLYEAGFITYMRTDSPIIADQALAQAEKVISKNYGADYSSRRQYASKSRSAQEAHEAIRPTDFAAENIQGEPSQIKLYRLIWARALGSQMATAQLDQTTAHISLSNDPLELIAKGEVVKFDGWLRIYLEDKKQTAPANILPPLEIGQTLELNQLVAAQTYSRSKARYSEASLVRKLEALDIGRPSTYAPTISTIQDRGYVEKTDHPGAPQPTLIISLKANVLSETKSEEFIGRDQNRLSPTPVGEVVTDFLVKFFPVIIDYEFTSQVEKNFDAIASGKLQWRSVLKEFYQPFHQTVKASDKVTRLEATQARELGTDPKSGKVVIARIGRYGPMVQIGKAEDEKDKPKFAGIPKDKKLDTITLSEALELFKLPRVVGPGPDGEDIVANGGPFGPYLKMGTTSVSLKEHDPLKISLDEALQLVRAKQTEDAKKLIKEFKDSPLRILNGRYGPYISDGKRNAAVPKTLKPEDLSLESAKEILDKAPRGRHFRGGRKPSPR